MRAQAGEKRRPRGASMITALMLGALALTLALTLAGMGFSHLTVSSRLSNISQARSLAEAVVSQAIEKIVTSEGKAFLPGEAIQGLTIDEQDFPGAPGGLGRLTFKQSEATAEGIPLSLNNIQSETSKTGHNGRLVPEYSVHLVGRGSHRGVDRTIEAIVHFPAYQYALSSRGQIVSRGALIIAAADKPEDLIPSVEQNVDQMLPGHIASNSNHPTAALDLVADAPIRITGDARANGGITDSGVILDGAKRENAGEIDLPVIDIKDFDPENFGGSQGLPLNADGDPWVPDLDSDGIPDPFDLKGRVRVNQDVTFSRLKLPSNGNKGAMLWVNGDITITDGLEGVGAIFATGDINIQHAGSSNLNSNNVCAIVAGGSLNLVGGSSQSSSFFQGVLASGGDMTFADVTVAGAAVSGIVSFNGSAPPADPSLTITDANFVNLPSLIDFEFDLEIGTGIGSAGGRIVEFLSLDQSSPGNSITTYFRPGVETKMFYDADLDRFTPGPGGWDAWNGFTQYDPQAKTGSPWAFYVDTHTNGPPLTEEELITKLTAFGEHSGPIKYQGVTYTDWDAALAALFPPEDTRDRDVKLHELVQRIVGEMVDDTVHGDRGLVEAMAGLNDFYDKYKTQPAPEANFSMDPNRFVQWDSRTKIALWREL